MGPDTAVTLQLIRSIYERLPLPEEGGGVVVAALRYQLELAHRLGQRHPTDVLTPQRDHLAVFASVGGVGGVDPKSGGQHPVVRGRSAAALDVAEHGHPDVLVDALLH